MKCATKTVCINRSSEPVHTKILRFLPNVDMTRPSELELERKVFHAALMAAAPLSASQDTVASTHSLTSLQSSKSAFVIPEPMPFSAVGVPSIEPNTSGTCPQLVNGIRVQDEMNPAHFSRQEDTQLYHRRCVSQAHSQLRARQLSELKAFSNERSLEWNAWRKEMLQSSQEVAQRLARLEEILLNNPTNSFLESISQVNQF